MRGLLFNLLEEVVSRRWGLERWDEALDRAGLDGAYTSMARYPDAELMSLIESAASVAGMTRDDFLQWAGRSSVPLLVGRYRSAFEAHLSTESFLLSVPSVVPPSIRASFPDMDVMFIDIGIERADSGVGVSGIRWRPQLCPLIAGFIEGIALHYGEGASIEHKACVDWEDEACVLLSTFDTQSRLSTVPQPSPAVEGRVPDPVRLLRRFERERAARLKAEELAAKVLFRMYEVIRRLDEANEELREREARFSAGVAATPDAVISADGEGKIWYYNHAAERMFGYAPEEARGEPLTILMPERFREAHLRGLRRFLDTGETRVIGRTLELAGLRKDGTEFPLEVSLASWSAKEGTFFVATLRDVSDRKRLQEELAQHSAELARSNAELEQFAYVASHDLQEPLRMVASYVQLLARRYEDRLDGDALDFIRFATEGVTRMQGLIDGLLAVSRVGSGGRGREAVDANEVLDDALVGLRAACKVAEATVTRDPLPVVVADRAQLAQVFQNLIGNSLKFCGPHPPVVHVTAERSDGGWIFAVRDNGIGIDTAHAERAFQIFQRLHARDEYPGTGLGLAICKKIVERHGGRIWVESDAGQGATFRFSMPERRGGL